MQEVCILELGAGLAHLAYSGTMGRWQPGSTTGKLNKKGHLIHRIRHIS